MPIDRASPRRPPPLLAPVLALLALAPPSAARAFTVYNGTPRTDVRVRITGGGNFGGNQFVDLSANGSLSCSFLEPSCTGESNFVLAKIKPLTVEFESDTFHCTLPIPGGGYAIFRQENRFPLLPNAPFGFYCESYQFDDTLVARVPYGVGATSRDVRFLVTGDPQYNAADQLPCDRATLTNPDGCTPEHWSDSDVGMRTMTDLVATQPNVRGVVIVGDLAHNQQKREFQHYKDMMGSLAPFFFDGVGNHDLDRSATDADSICSFLGEKCRDPWTILMDLTQRKRATRLTNQGGTYVVPYKDLVQKSVPNVHYSWDWHDVHFVQLNLLPTDTDGLYETLSPAGALAFLKQDLATYVGTSGNPVVIFHHYGLDCFSEGTCLKDDGSHYDVDASGQPANQWWSDEQRRAYWDVLKDYNVAAVFAGHYHLGDDGASPEDWHPDFVQPAGAAPRPDGRTSLPTFVSGATRGWTTYKHDPYTHHHGVFLDVTMDACNGMTVTRKDVYGTELRKAWLRFPASAPPGASCPGPRCLDVQAFADAACKFSATTYDANAVDPLGGKLTCTQSPASVEDLGPTRVTSTCTSSAGTILGSCASTLVAEDVTPPTLFCPPMTLECQGPAGAPFAPPQAADNCTKDVTAACTVTGDLPIGAPMPFCSATDAAYNSAGCYWNVRTVDTTPPSVTCPADLTVDPAAPAGAAVVFAATAADRCDQAPSVSCPTSGSIFPIGTTTASCTAQDASGNAAACSFAVHVRAPADMGSELADQLGALRAAGALTWPQTLELQARLAVVRLLLRSGRPTLACPVLRTFAHRAAALAPVAGAPLVATANGLYGALGCSP